MPDSLIIKDLSVSIENKIIVSGINLTVNPGEVHVIMGPNGSGKSSLALGFMGDDAYRIESGEVKIGNCDLLSLKPDERVKKGLFLSFQTPVSIPGVTLFQLLLSSYQAIQGNSIDIRKFYSQVKKKAAILGLKEDMLERDVNNGFSGGEKKKAQVLELLVCVPKFAIFDEIDTGLDVDAIKKVAEVIKGLIKKRIGVILITHNQKILKYIRPDLVHILRNGKIVKVGDHKLALEVEKNGYAKI